MNASKMIGNRIRELRNKSKLSQENLAYNANINVNFLGQIERGTRNPTIETLEKILTALNVSFEDFFSFEHSIKVVRNDTLLEKLILELATRNENEIELIYNIAKQILEFEDKKKYI